jgi:hypothetical protein
MAKLSKNEEKVLVYLHRKHDSSIKITTEIISEDTGLSMQETTRVMASLAEKGMVSGPEGLLGQTMQCLKEMDPDFTSISRGYAEHIILLASALAAADEPFLAQALGYELELVGLVGSRLRSSGIWAGNELVPDHLERWKSKEDGGIAFFMDAAVACGDLEIVERTPEPQFRMTKGGKGHVESLMRRAKP